MRLPTTTYLVLLVTISLAQACTNYCCDSVLDPNIDDIGGIGFVLSEEERTGDNNGVGIDCTDLDSGAGCGALPVCCSSLVGTVAAQCHPIGE